MSITPPGRATDPSGAVDATTSSTAAPHPKKKKNGFLRFICCGVPDTANGADEPEAPAHKVSTVSSGRPTTSSKPDPVKMGQKADHPSQNEKDALQPKEDGLKTEPTGSQPMVLGTSMNANGEVTVPSDARDQPLPELPKEASPSNPSVIVQPPSALAEKGDLPQLELPQEQNDVEGDVKMDDSAPITHGTDEPAPLASQSHEGPNALVLPPPPAVPQPVPTNDSLGQQIMDQKQQWLLPPIAPRFQGKKCLVLDLDETLVHSSFKVRRVEAVLVVCC